MPGVSFVGYLSIASAITMPFVPTEPEARFSGALLLGEPNGWRAKVVILWGNGRRTLVNIQKTMENHHFE